MSDPTTVRPADSAMAVDFLHALVAYMLGLGWRSASDPGPYWVGTSVTAAFGAPTGDWQGCTVDAERGSNVVVIRDHMARPTVLQNPTLAEVAAACISLMLGAEHDHTHSASEALTARNKARAKAQARRARQAAQ